MNWENLKEKFDKELKGYDSDIIFEWLKKNYQLLEKTTVSFNELTTGMVVKTSQGDVCTIKECNEIDNVIIQYVTGRTESISLYHNCDDFEPLFKI